MSYTSEAAFEADVIKTLVEEKGWKDGVLQYKDEKDLIRNWADIIFDNNRELDRLGDFPVTDGEMQQIMEQINALKTPLKLNGFINGGYVQIIRDNEDDTHNFGKTISLKIFGRNEITAGKTRYQIAEQPIFHAKNDIYPNRRGDFCLLINGMPLFHVELKKSGVPVSEAQYQIQKYLHEGVFTGIFSLVQIFVAMNPEECVYFANPGSADKFRKVFCFHWADQNNDVINDWTRITERLLSIPMAHELIGFYTVADQTDNTLKVMRSYQYYAASKISKRVSEMKWDDQNIYGGYVWHTTGSGKTMTSFKSAQLIANSKDADKVVFLMDRIELGIQSLREYRGFSDETDDVQATENTDVLVTKLKSDDSKNTLIVTSIQKMSRIKEDEGVNASDIEKINKKRIVFIVDECHRSVFGEMLSTIKHTFPGAIFIGFSGTPILEINKKKDTTTADVFGDELSGTRYTVADGMRDRNVLGFDTVPQPTYKDKDLRTAIVLEKAKANSVAEIFGNSKKEAIYHHWMDEVPMGEALDDDGDSLESIEGELPDAQYDRDEHRKAVVDDIIENWVSQSHNGKFHAMLATSSIPEAIKYYKELKSRNAGLKITAVFDPSDGNNAGSIEKIDGIAEILEDYKNTFGVFFNISSYANFKRDVCARLAHKMPYLAIENEPAKCLDILIVVDQMLTGYDSKWLNTLYMDKFYKWSNIEMIIQACFDKQVYDTLLQRYKELRRGGGGSGEGEEAYDIDPYLMALSTEKIDSDYMQSRFCKYVKSLDDQSDEETVNALLNELHRAFASLSQDQQKFANILLKDIQNHEIKVSDDKNVMELIIEYQSRAKDDQISAFARRIGVYEKKLREIMSKHPTENDINAFGQYDELIANVDIDTAKKYFDEVEGSDVPKRKVRAKLDELLRRFILEDGFDLAS